MDGSILPDALAVAALLLGVTWHARRGRARAASGPASASRPAPLMSAGKRRRLRGGAESGKLEPAARLYDPETRRFGADAPHFALTMPIAPGGDRTWALDRASPVAWGSGRNAEWVEVGRFNARLPRDGARCLACGAMLPAGAEQCRCIETG